MVIYRLEELTLQNMKLDNERLQLESIKEKQKKVRGILQRLLSNIYHIRLSCIDCWQLNSDIELIGSRQDLILSFQTGILYKCQAHHVLVKENKPKTVGPTVTNLSRVNSEKLRPSFYTFLKGFKMKTERFENFSSGGARTKMY